jgi:hypothetical protein
MKKYAIIIGENNEELSRKVQEALFEVGFEWGLVDGTTTKGVRNTNALAIGVNSRGNGIMSKCEDGASGFPCGAQVLSPSYVLEHAAELDGARKKFVIPPDGYRLVEDWEVEKYPCPTIGKLNARENAGFGGNQHGWGPIGSCWKYSDTFFYAVPVDFKFEEEKMVVIGGKEVSESTAAEALRAYFK